MSRLFMWQSEKNTSRADVRLFISRYSQWIEPKLLWTRFCRTREILSWRAFLSVPRYPSLRPRCVLLDHFVAWPTRNAHEIVLLSFVLLIPGGSVRGYVRRRPRVKTAKEMRRDKCNEDGCRCSVGGCVGRWLSTDWLIKGVVLTTACLCSLRDSFTQCCSRFSQPNQLHIVFTRDSIYAIARICHDNSVRLSYACFVSKRLNVSSKFIDYLIGPSF